MSDADAEAAAKRAAAAEARRQKILARGAERLTRITVGPSAASGGPSSSAPIAAAEAPAAAPTASAAPADATAAAAEPAPTAADEPEGSGSRDAAASVSPLFAGATAPEPALQAVPRPPPPQPTAAATPGGPQEGASTAAAAAVAADEGQPEPDSGPQRRSSRDGDADGTPAVTLASAPDEQALLAAAMDADKSLHQLLNQLAASAQLGLVAGGGGSDSGWPLRGPGPAAAPFPATAQVEAAAQQPQQEQQQQQPQVLRLLRSAGQAFGPELSAAVDDTRAARCLLALALAVALHFGVLYVQLFFVPPVIVLLATSVAIVAGARAVASRSPRSHFSKAGAGGETGDAPQPAARQDWLELLAPGLRPVLDRLASAQALASGLFADVAVFLVVYVVLDAWAAVTGGQRRG